MVAQLVVTFSDGIAVFSELERVVESPKPAQPMRPGRMAQQVYKRVPSEIFCVVYRD